MNVEQLKALIADLPNDALVVTDTAHAVIEAEARIGTVKEPNSMGFTEFTEDLYKWPAVFIYSPEV
jgi:hypothetical protein